MRKNVAFSQTENGFEELCNFIKETNFERVGVVTFLCEEDAPEIAGKVYFRLSRRIAPDSFVKIKTSEVPDCGFGRYPFCPTP